MTENSKDEFQELLTRLKRVCADQGACPACPIYTTCKRWLGKDRELCDFCADALAEVMA